MIDISPFDYYNKSMCDINEIKYRQLYFDMDGTIKQEIVVTSKEMTPEKIEQYEQIVADANQMTIFDFINE